MADSRFFVNKGPFTLRALALTCGGLLHDEKTGDRMLHDVAPLDKAGESDISFLDNKKYLKAFTTTKAGACVTHPNMVDKAPKTLALIVSETPYLAYATIASTFYPATAASPHIHPRSFIDPTASIGKECVIEAGVFVGANAKIGNGCTLRANAVIGDGVIIGDHSVIHAGVHISHTVIGNHVILHHGVAIGQDGFGYATDSKKGAHYKVPQLGRVMIHDHVEIGANTTIDRGAGPDTVIGAGTKIDNLVQIGHNVTLGRGCIVVAQVGIAGSTQIGDFTVIGGQAAIIGHVSIGSGVKIAGQSGVTKNLPNNVVVGGTPAVPITQYHRQTAIIANLVKGKK